MGVLSGDAEGAAVFNRRLMRLETASPTAAPESSVPILGRSYHFCRHRIVYGIFNSVIQMFNVSNGNIKTLFLPQNSFSIQQLINPVCCVSFYGVHNVLKINRISVFIFFPRKKNPMYVIRHNAICIICNSFAFKKPKCFRNNIGTSSFGQINCGIGL